MARKDVKCRVMICLSVFENVIKFLMYVVTPPPGVVLNVMMTDGIVKRAFRREG